MDGSGVFFEEFVLALRPDFDPVVLSYPSDLPLTYAELETWVHARLPRGEQYILLGESFSGPLAISVAATRPPGLCALVLVATFARNPVRFPSLFVRAASLAPIRWVPIRFAAMIMFGRFKSKAMTERLQAAISSVSHSVWRTRLRSALAVDVMDKLQRIAVPVLYLRAKRDHVVPRCAVDTIRTAVPALQVSVFDAPHFLLQTLPSEAAMRIREFSH